MYAVLHTTAQPDPLYVNGGYNMLYEAATARTRASITLYCT
jgi:hypothetical protein